MRYSLFSFFGLLLLGCGAGKPVVADKNYSSDSLQVRRISDHAYVHTSYMDVEGFGRVSCNGAVFFDGKEAVVLDTPGDEIVSEELIRWVEDSLHCKIKAIIPTHFHRDCLGGLEAFHRRGIPSYAGNATIALAESNASPIPQQGFDRSGTFRVGGKDVILEYPGAGHTKDNITGYLPDDGVLFGGCLVKASGANKGNLDDANVTAWPETIRKIKKEYPDLKIVVPGHGDAGGAELLDYTIELFRP
ncbi:subclass B1 metallo-beta-lactamase [Sinomicrobium pectinilyticum]|uniref:beta-lactamase n=1 Tax=Sinomicrobium pectinilyticum TaxID=1084421 RepID=A0A3N0DFL6_SINP1|nr:subclass B1 metallo-beta-lactamase [Sinomicrobium pectinilyticum]RNL74425.1 subclass B1 metallo-beta-lactamase [Sinomicrobium pectinilyticum]